MADTRKVLRKSLTDAELRLWLRLRNRQLGNFKFRRQHPAGKYTLDFYCSTARLSIELDGFKHGSPEQRRHADARKEFLASMGITELRFWNHQWRNDPEAVLLEIWTALHHRTGCTKVMKKSENHQYLAPNQEQLPKTVAIPQV